MKNTNTLRISIFITIIILEVIMINYNISSGSSGVINHDNNTLGIQINLEQGKRHEYFIMGQPIKVFVLFKSRDTSLAFNRRLIIGDEVLFKIKKPSGKNADFKLDLFVGSPSKEDFILLNQGEQFEISVNLNDYYIIDESGKYSIKAIYANSYNGQEFGFKAWIGSVESNTLEFIVLKPPKDRF